MSRPAPGARRRPPSLVDLCAELLAEVLRLDGPADGVLSSFLRRHSHLGSKERHVLAETTYEVLRRRLKLEHLAKGPPETMHRRLALLAWKGDRLALTRGLAPDERTWLNQVQALDARAFSEKLRHNLPDWLAQPLRKELTEPAFWALVDALDRPAPLDLRVNLFKCKRADAQRRLVEEGIDAQLTPHSPWGLRVDGRPDLQNSAMFKTGMVEVQDEGSQLLALLTDARRGEMVVDFCAGAGGKTLALGAAMRSTGRLYAFDIAAHRLAALKPRLARSGLSNVHTVHIAHERDDRIKRLAGKIDRVLVDAPCSGLGTLRRNPDLKWRQSPDSIAEMMKVQAAILDSAARLLKPGGRLVYATCSLLRAENEDIAAAFSAGHPGFAPLDAATLLAEAGVGHAETLVRDGALRLWPHEHGCDGFFAMAWQRTA
ncbi:MAG: RsmB/NOP family class I SAM-dependent RNA methyltransferase [Aquabacterium sp.]